MDSATWIGMASVITAGLTIAFGLGRHDPAQCLGVFTVKLSTANGPFLDNLVRGNEFLRGNRLLARNRLLLRYRSIEWFGGGLSPSSLGPAMLLRGWHRHPVPTACV